MYWYGGGWPLWGVVLTWVIMIGILAMIGWGVWTLASRSNPQRPGSPEPDGARQILEQRLVRGEIDADEYRRLRDLLGR